VIITRTPFPISLAGGGTDAPSFYRESGGGAVTSLAIDRFVHVLVSERPDPSIRVAYSRTENVAAVDEVEHGLVREALRLAQVHRAVEVHAIADLPGEGTADGASSSLAVGLLNALYRFKGQVADPSLLAEDASRIEVNILHGTPGKQAQYSAAFGGLNYLEFRPDDTVRVHPIVLSPADLDSLSEHLSLFYAGSGSGSGTGSDTPTSRKAGSQDVRLQMRDLAATVRDALVARDWDRVGATLDEASRLGGRLASGADHAPWNESYAQAIEAGAQGGIGIGGAGGGFLLLFHPPERSAQVAKSLSRLERMPVRISPEGSRVLLVHG
jgi:D-glycero-alpha-D-manno-heptose-7-phosphate kinase